MLYLAMVQSFGWLAWLARVGVGQGCGSAQQAGTDMSIIGVLYAL